MSPLKDGIANATGGDWNLEKWEDVEETVERLGESRREVEERIDEDNVLESKITWDCCLSLQPIKRLEGYLLCRGGF